MDKFPFVFSSPSEVFGLLSTRRDAFEAFGDGVYGLRLDGLRRALLAEPTLLETALEFGNHLWHVLGEPEAAEEVFSTFLAQDIDNVSARLALVDLQIERGKPEEALRLLLWFSARSLSDFGATVRQARALELLADRDGAVQAWERAVEARPGQAGLLIRLANAAADNFDDALAKRAIREAIAIDDELPEAHLVAAIIEYDSSNDRAAFRSLRRALELDFGLAVDKTPIAMLEAFRLSDMCPPDLREELLETYRLKYE